MLRNTLLFQPSAGSPAAVGSAGPAEGGKSSVFRNTLGRSARFWGVGRDPRIAPKCYERHYFPNPRRAPRRPRAPPGRRRVGKVVCFVTLWSVPRDSGDSEGILGSLQNVTKHTTFSTLGGLPGGRGVQFPRILRICQKRTIPCAFAMVPEHAQKHT